MPPSPTSFHVLGIVTTTVFVDSTTAPAAPGSGTKIPVGAIVGGFVGGVVIAVLAVVGWIWWGRSIKKKTSKEVSESRIDMLFLTAPPLAKTTQ